MTQIVRLISEYLINLIDDNIVHKYVSRAANINSEQFVLERTKYFSVLISMLKQWVNLLAINLSYYCSVFDGHITFLSEASLRLLIIYIFSSYYTHLY